MLMLIEFLLAMLVILQSQGATPATGNGAAPAAPAGGLLAGPKVAAASTTPARATIVERSFDGTLQPLEDEPEVVAVFALKLDPAPRAQLEQLAAARAKAFEDIVLAHYEEFLALGTDLRGMAQASPEQRGAATQRIQSVTAALAPFVARGGFLHEAAGVLTPEQQAEARRMADEWIGVRRGELRKEIEARAGMGDAGGGAGNDPAASVALDRRVQARMRLETVGGMVRRTIERRADARKAQFEETVRRLDLSPEQAEKVRSLFMAIAVEEIQGKRTPGSLGARERQRIFGELAKILDDTQRAKLRDMVMGLPADEPSGR